MDNQNGVSKETIDNNDTSWIKIEPDMGMVEWVFINYDQNFSSKIPEVKEEFDSYKYNKCYVLLKLLTLINCLICCFNDIAYILQVLGTRTNVFH